MAIGGLVYALASLLAAGLMAFDKFAAEERTSRIPEVTLLAVGLVGWPGAKFGQRYFRHKTRKQPFRSLLNVFLVGHLVLWGTLAWSVVSDVPIGQLFNIAQI